MDMVQKFNHLKSEPKVGQRTSSAQAEEELAFKQRAFNTLLGNFGRPDNDHPDRRTSGASNMAGMIRTAQQNAGDQRDSTPSMPGDQRYSTPSMPGGQRYSTPSMPGDSRDESRINDTASKEGNSSDVNDDLHREATSPTVGDGISPTNTGPAYRETNAPSYSTVNETAYYPDNAARETTYYSDNAVTETFTTEYVPGVPGIIRPI